MTSVAMPSILLLTAVAVSLLFAAGYLFGVRLGREARATLTEESRAQALRVAELTAITAQLEARPPVIVPSAPPPPAPAPPPPPTIDPTVDGLRRDLQKAMATLAAQRTDGNAEVRKVMKEMLAPVLDRERLGRDLSSIRVGSQGLGELPTLLDTIAERGGFSALVLSDEAGLPLAASANAPDVEMLAGTAAYFLTLADRAERAGLPRPLSCVVHDETNRLTLHRMFTVGTARFTLSAVSRGLSLPSGALDPALSPLERVLTRQAS